MPLYIINPDQEIVGHLEEAGPGPYPPVRHVEYDEPLQTTQSQAQKGDTMIHPAVTDILQHFEYGHLSSGRMRTVSAKCHDLAHEMAENWQLEGPELTAGLRHLLEAKDAFVRSALLANRREQEQTGRQVEGTHTP